jgi:hypothetical protein
VSLQHVKEGRKFLLCLLFAHAFPGGHFQHLVYVAEDISGLFHERAGAGEQVEQASFHFALDFDQLEVVHVLELFLQHLGQSGHTIHQAALLGLFADEDTAGEVLLGLFLLQLGPPLRHPRDKVLVNDILQYKKGHNCS